jgi:hypothetical protein
LFCVWGLPEPSGTSPDLPESPALDSGAPKVALPRLMACDECETFHPTFALNQIRMENQSLLDLSVIGIRFAF